MGIVSSIAVGGNDKCLNELLLDDIIDEVEGISGLLLVVAHSIKQHKQLGNTTDSVAAKNVLEELLRNAFDKLTCYYTIDVYTTCQELSDKKSPLLDSSNTTEEESHIPAKIGQIPLPKVEKYSTGHSKGNSSQTPLSRENSKTNSDEQQNLRSERGKDHDEKKNHEVGKDQDTSTETDNTRKRPHAYKFCAKKASEMLTKTEDVAMQIFEAYTESRVVVKPAKIESELVKLLKEVSLSIVPVVQQSYLRGKWDETCIEPLEPFIKKCLFLCWMMVVQSPPMVFDKNTEEGTKLESALYKQYTQTGDVLEYVVWPALFLHEDGPIVCKGVARPKKAKE
ncbi:hypothetical protein MAR_022857 [Mya arenaria]|uniref:Mitochondria-eating protein C-terminal domain-containing protein n=1 Tax=Mya arenaria TaxID=6604 RepID=A0ABY7DM93_MYAAR|nr:hypothetical protein MAR_022857 [Mya arenaria]